MVFGTVQVPNAGRNTVLSYQVSTQVDADALVALIRGSISASHKRAMQMVLNMVVGVTLPNNPNSFSTGKSTPGSYRPNKQQLKKLEDRMGKDFPYSNRFPEAFPNAYGRPILKGDRGILHGGPFNVATPRAFRGRPKKGRKVNTPDRVLGTEQLRKWVDEQSTFIEKNHTVRRIRKDSSAPWVWTTKAALKAVSKDMKLRAGNFIHGWDAIAQKVGSNAVKNATRSGGKYDAAFGVNRFEFSSMKEIVWSFEAENLNAPTPRAGSRDSTKNKQLYTQKVIDSQLGWWTERCFDKALREVNPKNILKHSKVRDMKGVSIHWAAD